MTIDELEALVTEAITRDVSSFRISTKTIANLLTIIRASDEISRTAEGWQDEWPAMRRAVRKYLTAREGK